MTVHILSHRYNTTIKNLEVFTTLEGAKFYAEELAGKDLYWNHAYLNGYSGYLGKGLGFYEIKEFKVKNL